MMLTGKRIHFMGVGGIGVSALAEMALRAGAVVSGCDRVATPITAKLAQCGVRIDIGHDPSHTTDIDLLVYSSAIPADHPERIAAGDRQERRGAFLASLLDAEAGWGIAGTHGKTTTTWLLAHIAIQAGLDPTVFVGGMVAALPDGNYRLGGGPFIAELDESDASFLLPRLELAIITNVESEHLSHYGSDEALFRAFGDFAKGVEESGKLAIGVDTDLTRDLYANHRGKKLSFGFAATADLRAHSLDTEKDGSRFRVTYRERSLGEYRVSLPGRHNVLNALAALGAALESGVDADCAREALASAKGVERRLERLGSLGGTVLYSDYAHHPTEVGASLDAIRCVHPGKVLVVFQPHLFSRTRDYADDFGASLAKADAVLLSDIYPAREEPLPGVSADLLAVRVKGRGTEVFGPLPIGRIAGEVRRLAAGFEAVVMMGAGSIDSVARSIAESL